MMRYAGVENDIIEKLSKKELKDLNELIKKLISLINGIYLYHFNGIRLTREVDAENNTNYIKMPMHNSVYGYYYYLTFTKKDKTISIDGENKDDYFHFELSETDLELTFRWDKDIISIKGNNKKDPNNNHFTISVYKGIGESISNSEEDLDYYTPDIEEEIDIPKENDSDSFKPEEVNEALEKAFEFSKTIDKAPYQKKWGKKEKKEKRGEINK